MSIFNYDNPSGGLEPSQGGNGPVSTQNKLPPLPPGMAGAILERNTGRGKRCYICNIAGPIDENDTYTHLIHLLHTSGADETIILNIYTPGGVVQTGINIIHAITNTKAHVTTIAMGLVASIGAVIWGAGHTRVVTPGSVLMFHMPSGGIFGKTADNAEESGIIQAYFSELLLRVTTGLLSVDEVNDIITRRSDLFLSADAVIQRLAAAKGDN